MPPEAWLMTAIGALATVVGILWRLWLQSIDRERKMGEEWKALALDQQKSIDRLTEAAEKISERPP